MARRVQEIGLSVKRLQVRQHKALNAALAALDVSLVQWDGLRHIDEHPGASLHDLALLTFQTDQSFGALAGRMIERGLIARVPGPGRAVRHQLTDKGLHLRHQGDAVVGEALARTFAPLTPGQLEAFDALLNRLLAAASDLPGTS